MIFADCFFLLYSGFEFNFLNLPALLPKIQGHNLPRRKTSLSRFTALLPRSPELNIGYVLRFLEALDPSITVTFLFVMAVVVGTVFGAYWTVFKKNMQDAWTIAAHLVSVTALAVMIW